MKKIIAVMLAVASTAAFSATLTSGTAVSTTNCTYLKEAVTVRLSADVTAAYDCAASKVGVGTAAVKGKGYAYGVSSEGGAIAQTPAVGSTATPFTNTAAAQAAAATRATASYNGS